MNPVRSQNTGRHWLAAGVLAGVTFLVFARALGAGFVNFDDPFYVTRNAHVTSGLSAAGTRWAFTTFDVFNWHPLTWLSLQLDATLFGTNARGFHLTNVLLHAANAAVLFLALRSLTGVFWRSAAVALLFAVHPLRVESVAWVAERKDVLSLFFGLLALWAYAAYARRPSAGRYLAVAGLFTLSLLAKPMLVTLPCLFLVLDWWPLRRLAPSPLVGEGRGGGAARQKTPPTLTLPLKGGGDQAPVVSACVREKLPLFALAAASCVVTYLAQSGQGAVMSLEAFPLRARVGNALVSYVAYLGQTFWPADLAPLYPHPGLRLPVWQVAGAATILAGLTAGAVLLRRRAPYLLAGWLWYAGTLVPVLGLVQAGEQARADRYTYFPQVGVLLALCWGTAAIARTPVARRALAAAAAAAAVALAVRTQTQLAIWHDSPALWEHEARVAAPSLTAAVNRGTALLEKSPPDPEGAARAFREALDLDPGSAIAHTSLGQLLFDRGQREEGLKHLETACAIAPRYALARINLGGALSRSGKLPEAAGQLETACEIAPDSGPAHAALGGVLLAQGKGEAAIAELRRAVECDPRSARIRGDLGKALAARGDLEGAGGQFAEATRLGPELAEAWYCLGVTRGRQGQVPSAVKCLERAVELEPSSPVYRETLKAAREMLKR